MGENELLALLASVSRQYQFGVIDDAELTRRLESVLRAVPALQIGALRQRMSAILRDRSVGEGFIERLMARST